MQIRRDPEQASQEKYDLIVVGGGIYGAMLCFEAVRQGISTLLLEKNDFGWSTSFNSLRIIHGGLRDLQSLNFRRFLEFGRERQWFLDHFPDLVKPLPVLLPLYQRGLKRKGIFRAGFMLDRVLSLLYTGFDTERKVPYGKVVSGREVEKMFSLVNSEGLSGGAVWYDAAVPDSQRLIIDSLIHANQMGATTLNYVKATGLIKSSDKIRGVQARDMVSGEDSEFHSDVVINAAGPWAREIAAQFDRDHPALYRYSIAWNILFDREAPSDYAVGVFSQNENGQFYFIHPWKGRLFAGTGHAPRAENEENPKPTIREIEGFLKGINSAVPGLQLRPEEILHIFPGYLPVEQEGTLDLTKQDILIDHGKTGGPEGAYSIGSTKLTAAHYTAEKILSSVLPVRQNSNFQQRMNDTMRTRRIVRECLVDYDWFPSDENDNWKSNLRQIAREEAVIHLDDLVLRRTALGDNPMRAVKLAPELAKLFDWDSTRRRNEIGRIEQHFQWIGESSDSRINV